MRTIQTAASQETSRIRGSSRVSHNAESQRTSSQHEVIEINDDFTDNMGDFLDEPDDLDDESYNGDSVRANKPLNRPRKPEEHVIQRAYEEARKLTTYPPMENVPFRGGPCTTRNKLLYNWLTPTRATTGRWNPGFRYTMAHNAIDALSLVQYLQAAKLDTASLHTLKIFLWSQELDIGRARSNDEDMACKCM
jgi:hypothetical protein